MVILIYNAVMWKLDDYMCVNDYIITWVNKILKWAVLKKAASSNNTTNNTNNTQKTLLRS